MRSFIRLFALICALLTATPAVATAQQTPSSWQLVDERRIEVAGAPYALSPDGQWLAGPGTERGTLCIWEVATLAETCSPELAPMIAPGSIRWSPDSTAVAFGMHAPSSSMRSDIFVYEMATGAFTNLTEEEPGAPGDDAGETLYPHFWNPAWSPDSQHLAFIAISPAGDGEETISLVTTPRSGGPLTEMATLDMADSIPAESPISWLEDGSMILTIWDTDGEDSANGIWRVTPEGELSQIVVADEASGLWLPYLVDVTDDGTRASMYSLGAYAADNVAPGTTYFMVDLATGEATSWEELLGLDMDAEDASSPDGSGLLMTAPVFSPDGTSAVFATERADGSVDVGVMNPDGSVSTLTTIPPFTGSRADNPVFLAGTGPTLSWADDDTVLVRTPYDAVLLTLER